MRAKLEENLIAERSDDISIELIAFIAGTYTCFENVEIVTCSLDLLGEERLRFVYVL